MSEILFRRARTPHYVGRRMVVLVVFADSRIWFACRCAGLGTVVVIIVPLRKSLWRAPHTGVRAWSDISVAFLIFFFLFTYCLILPLSSSSDLYSTLGFISAISSCCFDTGFPAFCFLLFPNEPGFPRLRLRPPAPLQRFGRATGSRFQRAKLNRGWVGVRWRYARWFVRLAEHEYFADCVRATSRAGFYIGNTSLGSDARLASM